MSSEVEQKEDSQLIGVHLITGGKTETKTCLGVVIVPSKHDLSLNDLRTVLYCQVTTLPEKFRFCSQHGWNINKNLESSVLLKQVLSQDGSVFIERHFERPHIGVCHKSGDKLGLIFIDLNSSLTEVRHCINTQMSGSRLTKHYYWFLTHNGWPISCNQESQLTVIDLLEDSCLNVDIQTFLTPMSSPLSPSPQPRKKIKGTRHLSFRTSKDLQRKEMADSSMTDEKQILISYVRVEAAHHAIALKQELSSLGYSVYLDVHEIKSGADWQDSLNDAVRNCQVFVPLVTPKYGETLWTNREVKLADILGKYIIPVSFLSEWPPQSLAIQFSTTQYINWKYQLNSGERNDILTWDTKDLKYVAQQISEKVLQFINTDTDFPSLVKRKTVVRSCPFVDVSNPQATVENREGHPLVVICVHPQQSGLGEEMKAWLEGHDFEVWCSTQLSMGYPDSLTDIHNCIKPGTIEIRNRQIFQEQADESGVIILVLSQQFVQSRTCQQQVFYCEQRKKLIPLLYGDFVTPGWLTVLTEQHVLMNADTYKIQLLKRVQQLLLSTHFDKETEISVNVSELRKSISNRLSVYIAGCCLSDDDNTENIYRLIGTHLASIGSIVLGTGGSCGVEDIVAQAFYQETQKLLKTNKVLHVLPQEKEITKKDYGQIVHIGDSIDDCCSVISKVFDILIVIRGTGNPEQVDLCDSFMWNEKTVIPVLCTECDISQLSEKPQDIKEDDWSILTDSMATPEEIGRTIMSVILQNSHSKHLEQSELDKLHSSSPTTALRKMTTVMLPE